MGKIPGIRKLVEWINILRILYPKFFSLEFAANITAGVYPGLARLPKTLRRRLALGLARQRAWPMGRIPGALRAGLVHPALPFCLAALGAIYGLPTLWIGLSVDDDLLQRQLLRSSSLSQAASQMFTFLDPATNLTRMDRGDLPWWTQGEARVIFFRPLSALTHWLDYRLWPDSPWLMHLHSLAWYALLCLAAAFLFRRILGDGLPAGLAAVLFTVNITHFFSLNAVNARNVLIGAVFGILTLILHDRWRRQAWRPAAWVAPAALLLTLLSTEAGLAIAGYLAAYALFLDPGKWRQRLGSLVPYGVVVFAWRSVYQFLGFGAWGSNFYLDPGREPARFAWAVLERWVVLLFGQWAMPDPGLYTVLSLWARRGYWLLALGFAALAVAGLSPLLRKSAPARFLGLGMALALIPVCAVNPATGRHLMFSGLGMIGLLALLCVGLAEKWSWLPSRLLWRTPAWISGVHLFLLQGLVFPILVVSAPAVLGGEYYTSLMDLGSLPIRAEQEVMIVNAPSPGQSIYMLSLRSYRGQVNPARLRILAPGHFGVTLSRLDAVTLLVRPEQGYLPPPDIALGGWRDLFPLFHPSYAARYGDSFFRSNEAPLALGQEVALSGMRSRVTALTQDGRPWEVRLEFDRTLEDPSLRWLAWDWQRQAYRLLALPAVGQTLHIPGPF